MSPSESSQLEDEMDQATGIEELTDEDLEDVGGGWSGDDGNGDGGGDGGG